MDQVKSSGTVTHINDQGSRHLSQEAIEKLIQQSQEAKQHAYCPYSKFRVGAALLTMDNTVFRGCNVENDATTWVYVLKGMLSQKRFLKATEVSRQLQLPGPVHLAMWGLQAIHKRGKTSEFGLNCDVYLSKPDGSHRKMTVDELLPVSFGPEELDMKKVFSSP
ncbi:hypothetical protein F7725_016788 [Dissostichus mawsoni]|uniref:CMP/dCMP-type deaminase domain-containing protein n=1 Tax=Dissostichus mawsoni TaxID=36200 RepID=A0A7J5Z2K2_DISMA|nr:hypothetical protein F7725_016788 [Dissostichus mawsoni]